MSKHVLYIFLEPIMSNEQLDWLTDLFAGSFKVIVSLILHKNNLPLNSIDVTHNYDLKKNDKQQGECCCIVIEYCEPIIPWRGGEAQSKQQTEHTH